MTATDMVRGARAHRRLTDHFAAAQVQLPPLAARPWRRLPPAASLPSPPCAAAEQDASRLVFVSVKDAKPKRKVAVPIGDGATWEQFLGQVCCGAAAPGGKRLSLLLLPRLSLFQNFRLRNQKCFHSRCQAWPEPPCACACAAACCGHAPEAATPCRATRTTGRFKPS